MSDSNIVSWTPATYVGWLLEAEPDALQPDTVVVVFQTPVQTVDVQGSGAVKCSGAIGTVIGYDAAGNEAGRQDLEVVYPEDCSPPHHPDDLAGLVRGILTVSSATIARIKITPLSPFSTETIDYLGNPYTAFLGLRLGVSFPPPPDTLCKVATQNPAHTAAFNDPSVRRTMDQMLADSDTLGPPSGRREQFGYVRRNPDGSFRIDRVEPDSRLNHCQNSLVVPIDPTILAVVHTHPYRDREDMLCPGEQPGTVVNIPYDGQANDGGSDPDWVHKAVTNYRRGQAQIPTIPYYLIDVDVAYFMHPDALQGERANPRINRRGGPGGCKWVL